MVEFLSKIFTKQVSRSKSGLYQSDVSQEPKVIRPLPTPSEFGPKVNKNYINMVKIQSDEEIKEELTTPTFKKVGDSPTRTLSGGKRKKFDFKPKANSKYDRNMTKKLVDGYGELPLMGGRSSTFRIKLSETSQI